MRDQAENLNRSGVSASGAGANEEPRKHRINWDDPSVPVGNAPPLPRWPVVVIGLAWFLWLVLMFALALGRALGEMA